jgi:hypothetical protein
MSEFDGVTKWVGSAQVTVDGEGAIAGVAQQIDSARDTGTAYNGFLEGVNEVELPLIMEKNNDMWTSINCQNLGPGAADVTVEFVPEAGYATLPDDEATGVLENGTAVFLQYDYAGEKWVGAAKVTNSAGNDMACIVNQTNLVKFYASAYEGFDAAGATDTSLAPLVQYQEQGDGMPLWTSVNVKNLSSSESVDLLLDFKPRPGFADVTSMTLDDVDPGAVGVFLFYNPYGNGNAAIGGAEVTADPDVPLAVVVNQQKVNYTGDVYSSYNGFSK